MTRYFGDPWPSGVCEDGSAAPTPIGEACAMCNELIVQGDQGWYMGVEPAHRECALRAVIGGIGHLTDHDFYCVGPGQDTDAGRSFRQSAIEVWDWVQANGVPG